MRLDVNINLPGHFRTSSKLEAEKRRSLKEAGKNQANLYAT
jgi:hypothetical protein